MKRIRILFMLVALMLAATQVSAKGPQKISDTTHNLSSTATVTPVAYKAGTEDEVCIFCHTPHGGSLNGPLWNRNLPVGAFTHYTSATLLPAPVGTWDQARAVNAESLLCMSCHDGAIGMNAIINYSNRTGALPDNGGNIVGMWFAVGTAIGDALDPFTGMTTGATRDLTDDHPISFSYTAVQTTGTNSNKLKAVGTAETNGVRFFGATKRVECSTCHDPHVNYTATGNTAYAPFLITPNTGSALCLACHIK